MFNDLWLILLIMISPLVVLPVVPVVNLRVMQIRVRVCEYILNVLTITNINFTLRHTSHQTPSPTSVSGSLPLIATSNGGYDESWTSFLKEFKLPLPTHSQTQWVVYVQWSLTDIINNDFTVSGTTSGSSGEPPSHANQDLWVYVKCPLHASS